MSAGAPTLDDTLRGLYPFAPHRHAVGPHLLHYVDEGTGDPLLLLHGNPTWSFYYRRLILAARDRCRVIAPDHMGCGLSDKPQRYPYTLATHVANLESLVAALGLEKITLVLHDWGGAIGMGYATRHPENVSRIVILNTAAFFSPRIPLRIRVCRTPVFGALAVRGLNVFARAALTQAAHRPLCADTRRGYLFPYSSWENRVAILRFVQDIPRSPSAPSFPVLRDIEDGLSRLGDVPVQIHWGARDWCFDESFLNTWRARFPEALVRVYSDAAHYVLEDAHERILPEVLSFLEAGP